MGRRGSEGPHLRPKVTQLVVGRLDSEPTPRPRATPSRVPSTRPQGSKSTPERRDGGHASHLPEPRAVRGFQRQQDRGGPGTGIVPERDSG